MLFKRVSFCALIVYSKLRVQFKKGPPVLIVFSPLDYRTSEPLILLCVAYQVLEFQIHVIDHNSCLSETFVNVTYFYLSAGTPSYNQPEN